MRAGRTVARRHSLIHVTETPPRRNDAIEVAELGVDALAAVNALVVRVWGSPDTRPLIETNTLRAMMLAGEQVLGVFPAGRAHEPDSLIGVSIAFIGTHPGGFHLHSHITGIDPDHQHAGLGFALKLAQRDWALARGITEVRWTFDPLVTRNAHFNLTKLGARGVAYHVNLYGAMPDTTNAGDESDRIEARWDLTEPVGHPAPDVASLCRDGAPVVLDIDPAGAPSADADAIGDAHHVVLARGPADILAIRLADPSLAREWRLAARATLGALIDRGFIATAATRDGWWVLERVE